MSDEEDEYTFGDEDDDTVLVEVVPGEEAEVPAPQYEYLDHPADVQIHAWGASFPAAAEQAAHAMLAYMSRHHERVQQRVSTDITARGHDQESLLFSFLDELLYRFSTHPYLYPRVVRVTHHDPAQHVLTARAYGEPWDQDRFQQGTEVKAVTYSNMQIHTRPDGACDIFVIVDI